MKNNNNDAEVATLASGCFWCSEAVSKRVKGIKTVLLAIRAERRKILPTTKYAQEK
jgi:peptide methionine sulfoxide reductase MsrA